MTKSAPGENQPESVNSAPYSIRFAAAKYRFRPARNDPESLDRLACFGIVNSPCDDQCGRQSDQMFLSIRPDFYAVHPHQSGSLEIEHQISIRCALPDKPPTGIGLTMKIRLHWLWP